MSTTAHTTAEELLRTPADGLRRELVAGEVRTMSPAGSEHGGIVVNLTLAVGAHVRRRRLGTVFGAETGFVLARNPDTVRAPDVAFVRRERIPAGGWPKGFFPGPPDLAIEVVSPTDRAADIDDKVADWLRHGTVEVWLVDPAARTVSLHRAAADVRVLAEGEAIECPDLLPGFACPVADVFAQ